MSSSESPKGQPNGGRVAVGVGVGLGVGAAVGATTGDWSWTPTVLSVCIAVGALTSMRIRR